MALLWLDGLDKYTIANDLVFRGYTPGIVSSNETQYQAAAGRSGGGAIRTRKNSTLDVSDNIKFSIAGVAAGSTVHFAAWMKVTLADLFNSAVLNFANAATGRQAGIRIHTSGGDYAIETSSFRGSASFQDEAANPGYFSQKNGVYVHIEVAFKGDPTTGFCKVWLDENPIINFTGNTTSGFAMETINQISFGGRTIDWDDVVVWNDSGTDFAPTQLKRHKIETLNPSAAGNDTDFTPHSLDSPPLTNFECVSETGIEDGDDTYVQAFANGDRDTYELQNISSNPHIVYAVATNIRAEWVTNPFNLNALLRHGTDELNVAVTLSNVYAHHQSLFYVDPTSGVEFTPSDLNALQAGYERTA